MAYLHPLADLCYPGQEWEKWENGKKGERIPGFGGRKFGEVESMEVRHPLLATYPGGLSVDSLARQFEDLAMFSSLCGTAPGAGSIGSAAPSAGDVSWRIVSRFSGTAV